MECVVGDLPSPEPVVSHCMIGDEDAAEWLVRNGWAEAASDDYRQVGDAARRDKLGIWGSGPVVP